MIKPVYTTRVVNHPIPDDTQSSAPGTLCKTHSYTMPKTTVSGDYKVTRSKCTKCPHILETKVLNIQ